MSPSDRQAQTLAAVQADRIVFLLWLKQQWAESERLGDGAGKRAYGRAIDRLQYRHDSGKLVPSH